MFYIPKIDWQRREGFYCIPLNFTEYHQSISEEENLRKVAGSFYIFLTTSGQQQDSNQQSLSFFFIEILSMQGWTATTRHGVIRKRSTKRLEHIANLIRKNLQLKDVC